MEKTVTDTYNGITIIIPAYNEESGIEKVLDSFNTTYDDYEIIVIDDGSSDKTADIVKKYLNVKLVLHEKKSGYGAALKTGIKYARGSVIVVTDADATYPNERIQELVSIFQEGNYDMVVGARTGENVQIPLMRRPAKWFINKLADYLAGTKIPDLNSGLRVIKKDIVEKFIKILPDNFSFTTTITLALLTNSYSVKYIPVDYYKRKGKSKIRPVRDTLNFIQLIVRTIMYFDPLKVFLPMSLALFVMGLILLLYRIFVAKAFVTTIFIFFIASFQMFALGMLADLIDKRMKD